MNLSCKTAALCPSRQRVPIWTLQRRWPTCRILLPYKPCLPPMSALRFFFLHLSVRR